MWKSFDDFYINIQKNEIMLVKGEKILLLKFSRFFIIFIANKNKI